MGTVGRSSGIRWTWVPSRSSQVNSARVGRRLHPHEAEQLEQLGGALDLGGSDLDADVVEHQSKSDTRAAATTIAVDQVTASAVISMSRP